MNKNILRKVAILAASLIVVSGGAIAANIPEIAKQFPDVPMEIVEMLTTIPALFIIFSVLLSNTIARYIGYKRTVLLGMGIVLVAGIAPAFVDNFTLIFILRALLGVGIGLFNSLLVGFIRYFYSGDERATLIGYQSAFEGIGGIVITFMVGQLLKINWQTSFWVYLITLPMLLLFALFVPDISYDDMDKKNTDIRERKNKTNESDMNTFGIVGYIILLFVAVNIYMTITVKVTTLMTTVGYGNATDGSNIMALIGVGAMSAGFMFGRVFRIIGKYTLPIAFSLMAIAMLIIGISNSVIVTGVGAILCGFGFRTFIPYLFNKVNSSKSINAGLSTSLLLVGFNLGSAFSPYGIALLERVCMVTSTRGIFFIESIILVIFSLSSAIFIIIKSVTKKDFSLVRN